MPTGYTAGVGDGSITTLRQYALRCARAFGATISMRDDPMDAPIPERFEPSTSHNEARLDEAREKLAQISKLSEAQCENRAKADFEARLASHRADEAEKAAENARYRKMIADVEAWETEAEGIKDFMLQQLRISISDYRSDPPTLLSGPEWLAVTLRSLADDIAYHEKTPAEEVERTVGRNRWLADLRKSLPADEAAEAQS